MPSSSSSIVAAVVQCGTVYNDTPATILKMRKLALQCKEKDSRVQLVVFPEAFIGGESLFYQGSWYHSLFQNILVRIYIYTYYRKMSSSD